MDAKIINRAGQLFTAKWILHTTCDENDAAECQKWYIYIVPRIPCERVIRNTTIPALVPTEQANEVRLLF